MEESDVIVKQAKIRVVSADSKDELADKIKAAIEKQIPNMEIEFTTYRNAFQRINFRYPI
jgi:cobalt-zinc-cadmium resistance protein CzcA